jgi:sulfhydrogenase subunit beta (sulfur reductase)
MTSKEQLVAAVGAAIAKGHAVFAPVRQDGLAVLARVQDPAAVDFDHVLTVNTVKEVLLPRSEPIARLDLAGQTLSPIAESGEPIVIFGTRPCDAAGVAILDSILLGSLRDERYEERRKRSVIVTLACGRSDDACFCTSMGYGPHDATASDVLVLPAGGAFAVKALTEKGKAFVDAVGLKQDVGASGEGSVDKPPILKRKVDTADLKAWLDANFASDRWRKISENCASCGTCYYLCPTCHCFDIADESGLSKGERLRIWDCCSFSDFTKMASHQPRLGRHARYRQRIMHKFSYCPDNSGKVACVGDGRCVRHCPYGVDVCEAIERLVAPK